MNTITKPITGSSTTLALQAQPNHSASSVPVKHNPIRLADTKTLNHDEWLEVRKQGIGSSDSAVACGINPFMSMLELWLIKTGRSQPGKDEISGYAPLYWGNMLEPVVAKFYKQHTGNKVRRVNAVLQHPDPDKSFMLANLDYAVVGNDEVQILECKTTGEHGSKLWKNGVPLYVTCQVQHQLAVTGKQAAHICVLHQGHEAKIYKVSRDDWLIKHIIEAEKQFWHYVETDTPPPPDHSDSASKAIKALYPKEESVQPIDFREDDKLNKLFDRMVDVKQALDRHKQVHDSLKHKIQCEMKDHSRALFKQGSVTWRKTKDSISLDSKALLKDEPDLLEIYQKVKKGSRRFMVYEYDTNNQQ